MIDELALPLAAPIADVGGGASHLAAELVDRGYTDVTVADISGEALERARDGFAAADRVTWVIADVRAHDFGRRFRLWHDRAVFQIMVAAEDRRAYVATLERSLDPGVTRSLRPSGRTARPAAAACRWPATAPVNSPPGSVPGSTSSPAGRSSTPRPPEPPSSSYTGGFADRNRIAARQRRSTEA
jgi:SAM-dependent methyltransferase